MPAPNTYGLKSGIPAFQIANLGHNDMSSKTRILKAKLGLFQNNKEKKKQNSYKNRAWGIFHSLQSETNALWAFFPEYLRTSV